MCHFFINLEKLYFVPILSAFGLKTPRALTILKPQTTTFLKKTWLYHFLSYIKPTPFKGSEIPISYFREKPQANRQTDKQTNVRSVFHRTFSSCVPQQISRCRA